MIYALLSAAIGALLVTLGAPWLGVCIMAVCLALVTEMTLRALRWLWYDSKEDE